MRRNKLLVLLSDGKALELLDVEGLRLLDYRRGNTDFETGEPVADFAIRIDTAEEGQWYLRGIEDDVPRVSDEDYNAIVLGLGSLPDET